jgi:hypothetical protein
MFSSVRQCHGRGLRWRAIFSKFIKQYFIKTTIFGDIFGAHNLSGYLPDCGKAEKGGKSKAGNF